MSAFHEIITATRKAFGEAPRRLTIPQVNALKMPMPRWVRATNDPRFRDIGRHQGRLLTHGRVVWGAIAQANQALFMPGKEDCPAAVIYSLDPRIDQDPERLRQIAGRLFEVKGTDVEDKELQRFADALADETGYTPRLDIPTRLGDGIRCHYANLMVHRSHLPDGVLSKGYFPLLVEHEQSEAVMIVPSRYWDPRFVGFWNDSQDGPEEGQASMRAAIVKALADQGLTVSQGLPLRDPNPALLDPLRIARRLFACKLLFAFVAIPPERLSTSAIQAAITANRLGPVFTKQERGILSKPRATAQIEDMDAIGWSLENMAGLAWIFGSTVLEEAGLDMCSGDLAARLLFQDSPQHDATLVDWIGRRELRSVEEIVQNDDFHYCLLNAVRNIAFSNASNPTTLDPRVLVGIAQERFHALAWALSNCAWEDTDLST